MSRWKKVAVPSALLVLALLGFLLTRGGPERSREVAQERAAAPEAPTGEVAPPSPRALAPQRGPSGEPVPPVQTLPPPSTPTIEEVVLDKKSVCFNEDVLVTVRARTPDGRDDAFLRYRVGDEEGPVVSLRRLSSATSGLPERGGLLVTVFGRDGSRASVPLPPLEVRECRVPNEFELVASVEPGSDGVVRLVASPIGHNPDVDEVARTGKDTSPTFQPVKYSWTFGDGSTVETSEGSVVHDFGQRPQASLFSYFLVTCEASDAQGNTLVARKSVELKNPAFEQFMTKGTVRLLASPAPARVEADGRVTVPVRLWHTWASPVRVTAVKLRRHRGVELNTSDESNPPSTPSVEPLSAGALGAVTIPGGGWVAPLSFDAASDRDVVAKEFRVEGVTPEGWPVRGTFVVTRPEVDPVVRRMLVDLEWRSKVLRARKHLDKAEVTEKEVRDLEGAGLFLDMPRAFEGTPPPGFAPPSPPSAEDAAW